MLELAHMRTFLAVYRAGSFTGAAQRLHLSQPTVTNHLKSLEARLGRPLFVRLPRGIAPTPHGHALARELMPHLDALERLSHTLLAGDRLAGPALLGGPADMLSAVALPALTGLMEQGVEIRARTGLPEALLPDLAAGVLDVVIATRRLPRRGVAYRKLFDEQLVLLASPAWARRIDLDAIGAVGPAAFAAAPLVAYDEELPLIRRYVTSVFETTVSAGATLIVDDLRGVRDALIAGAGVSVLPYYLVADALRRGALVELFRPRVPPSNPIHLAVRSGAVHPRTAAVGEVLMAAAPEWQRR